jgi:hypothetical protein
MLKAVIHHCAASFRIVQERAGRRAHFAHRGTKRVALSLSHYDEVASRAAQFESGSQPLPVAHSMTASLKPSARLELARFSSPWR